MKKRILITGATGFIGYHLIKAALADDLEVYANVRKSSNVDHLENLDVRYVELDFESIFLLKNNIEEYQYDYIIHAAAATKAENLKQYIHFNASYTRNLAVAATSASHKIKKFVFVSSLAALGPLHKLNERLVDNGPSHPVTDYGKSKALAETYLGNITDLPLIIFRPTAVYGPREREILLILKAIKRGFEVYIGQKEQALSFIYVSDLADVIIGSLKSKFTKKTYNISDGNIYGQSSFAKYAKAIMQKRTLKLKLPLHIVKSLSWALEKSYKLFKRTPTLNIDKINELTGLNWSCDIKNIKQDLGFVPRYQLEQGLEETIKWYRNNNWL